MCAARTPAVNVNALLTECTQTEITVGQRTVGAEGVKTTDPQSSHTSGTADLLAKNRTTSLLGQILSFVTHSSSFLWLTLFNHNFQTVADIGKLFFRYHCSKMVNSPQSEHIKFSKTGRMMCSSAWAKSEMFQASKTMVCARLISAFSEENTVLLLWGFCSMNNSGD